jgi:LPS O-antigen subunit length determinant protein (WzzB/FepE family)
VRSKLVPIFSLLVLVLCVGPVVAQNPDQTGAEEQTEAQSRYQSALLDEEMERERLHEDEVWFNSQLATRPSDKQEIAVSFSSAISLKELLDSSDAVQILVVHSWIFAEGKLNPITGIHDLEADLEISKQGAQSAIGSLEEAANAHLESRLASLDEALDTGERGAATTEQVAEQKTEVEEFQSKLRQDGIQVYGFECLCSAETLSELEKTLGASFLSTEPRNLFPHPVWPANPLRDRIIASRGEYGRS